MLAVYSGTKAWLSTWSAALGEELKDKGIDVECTNTYFVVRLCLHETCMSRFTHIWRRDFRFPTSPKSVGLRLPLRCPKSMFNPYLPRLVYPVAPCGQDVLMSLPRSGVMLSLTGSWYVFLGLIHSCIYTSCPNYRMSLDGRHTTVATPTISIAIS